MPVAGARFVRLPGLNRLLVALALIAAGCHHRLPRLVEQERYAEVVERVAASRHTPRKAAARAHAEALEHLGRTDEARTVLLRDYRRGGRVESMIALADLERRLGLEGVAAMHYGRALLLDQRRLAGREDVCGLFRNRARLLVAQGEGLAAHEDMRRVKKLCGGADENQRRDDDRLVKKIIAVASQQVRDRHRRHAQTPNADAREDAIDRALSRARERGPRELRATAARLQVELAPADVLGLLMADLDGELGLSLLSVDELRAWVGNQGWNAFADEVAALARGEAAYARLQLGRVLLVPPAGEAGPEESRAALVMRALDALDGGRSAPPAAAWRVLALVGDLPAAELTISAALQTRALVPEQEVSAAHDTASPAGPTEVPGGAEMPRHWTSRVPVDAGTLPHLLAVARLRRAAEDEPMAFAIARNALSRARAAHVSGAGRWIDAEARRLVGTGRPWQGLALADLASGDGAASGAAATAILLGEAVCGGSCPDDPDLEIVRLALGESWVENARARLVDRALARRFSQELAQSCRTLSELLAEDAVGPLAEALQRVRDDPSREGLGADLGRALEADPTFVCAGRYATPLMATGGRRIVAAAVSEALSHGLELEAAGGLEAQAEVALVAGHVWRARQLFEAAAGLANDPGAVWTRAARAARAADDRDLELRALRRVLLHSPGLRHDPARRDLLLRAMRDAREAWEVQNTELGREALVRLVDEYVSSFPAAQRWHKLDEVARALSAGSWRPDAVSILEQALWTPERTRQRHPWAAAALTRAAEPEAELPPMEPMDLYGLELHARAGGVQEVPAEVAALAAIDELDGVRLAVASLTRGRQVRARTAIAAAVHGGASSRAEALQILMGMVAKEPARKRAVVDWLLEIPAALEPGIDASVPIVADSDVLLRIVFGLDLDPTTVAR